MDRVSESGLPINAVYDDRKLTDFRPGAKLSHSGEYPFTRGEYMNTYSDRPLAVRHDAIECLAGAVERTAGQVSHQIGSGNRVVLGVNKFTVEHARMLTKLRESRDTAAVRKGH
jgi:methylmalonyl-CoA mutase N-terminal domain/subunit